MKQQIPFLQLEYHPGCFSPFGHYSEASDKKKKTYQKEKSGGGLRTPHERDKAAPEYLFKLINKLFFFLVQNKLNIQKKKIIAVFLCYLKRFSQTSKLLNFIFRILFTYFIYCQKDD